MMTTILVAFLLLTLIAAIFHAISYQNSDDMSPKAMILSLAATILAAVAFFSMGSGDSVTGGYLSPTQCLISLGLGVIT